MKILLAPLPVIDLLVVTAIVAFAGTIGTAHYHSDLAKQSAAAQRPALVQFAAR